MADTYVPLGDNPDHVAHLCNALELGALTRAPRRLGGGFHHLVWRLETRCGTWVVKQLSPDTDLGDPAVVAHFNGSEAVAEKFAAHGIRAVHALSRDGDYLQLLEDTGYLVFPWSDAQALEEGDVSPPHALAVAELLAAMHSAGISAAGLALGGQEALPEADVAALVGEARDRGLAEADELERRLPGFRAICARHEAALRTLERHQVVSHGDLDQKNVMWDTDGRPVLIDWESACRLNPTFETVQEALDWSGLLTDFDRNLFGDFVKRYRNCGGPLEPGEVEAALQCVQGEWLDWLAYNIGRCLHLKDPGQRDLGHQQVALALSTLSLLEDLQPELLSILQGQSRKT